MEHVTQSMRREYWKSIIAECCSSGMKKKDWMELNHISHKSFYYWQKKLRIEAGTDLILANNNEQGIPAPFVQVALPDESHEDKNAIIHGKQVDIEIAENISDEFLMRIIRAASNA